MQRRHLRGRPPPSLTATSASPPPGLDTLAHSVRGLLDHPETNRIPKAGRVSGGAHRDPRAAPGLDTLAHSIHGLLDHPGTDPRPQAGRVDRGASRGRIETPGLDTLAHSVRGLLDHPGTDPRPQAGRVDRGASRGRIETPGLDTLAHSVRGLLDQPGRTRAPGWSSKRRSEAEERIETHEPPQASIHSTSLEPTPKAESPEDCRSAGIRVGCCTSSEQLPTQIAAAGTAPGYPAAARAITDLDHSADSRATSGSDNTVEQYRQFVTSCGPLSVPRTTATTSRA